MATQRSILLLNRTFPPTFGATGRVACDLVLHLRKLGYKITVITTASVAKIDRAKNLDVIRVEGDSKPNGIFGYLKVLNRMKKAARNLPRHDFVISMTDPPMLATIGHTIAKKMRAKHIYWAMDLYPDLLPVIGKSIPKFFYKRAQSKMQKAAKLADAIVPISKCMARYMAHQSLPRHKMHIIENWPDLFLLNEPEDTSSIQTLLDGQKFRILYAGTIGLAHEFDTVLNAAKYFQKTDPEIEFIFTDRGSGKQILETKKMEMKLDNIRFIRPQSSKNLANLMATGDIHLVTMKKEAAGKLFPSKFYSALAAKRPILFVGPDQCDIHRQISQNHCGATIRNGDSRTLVNAILNYKNNGDAWFKACDNAGAVLKNHHPLKEWEDLIASL